jgi:hypothetical protein
MSGMVNSSIPKPSVPEFTIKNIDNSYYMPPTYGTDPYSGKTIQTGGGFIVQNKSIELTIKNQPFTSYRDGPYVDSNNISLYYQIGYKGHFEDQWHYYTTYAKTGSEYTVILAGLIWDGSQPTIALGNLPAGSQVDFQVQAEIGYFTLNEHYPILVPQYGDFHGESSGWSNTQTITVGDNTLTTAPSTIQPSLSPSESQNPTPNQSSAQTVIPPETDWTPITIVASLGVIVVIVAVTAVFLYKRRVKR